MFHCHERMRRPFHPTRMYVVQHAHVLGRAVVGRAVLLSDLRGMCLFACGGCVPCRYDAHNSEPLFPFGHGLSYTTFAYSHVSATSVGVNVTVSNSGPVSGSEVAQLYLSFPASAGEPPQQLKGFEKVVLAPGESVIVTFPLTDRDLSIWDINSHAWAVQHGAFTALVGSSSRDIRGKAAFSN
jgi:hypothetical protein